MASIKTLCEYVHAEIPSCPSILIEQKLQQAVQEFCRSSLAWQLDLDPVRLTDGKDRYQIRIPRSDVVFEKVILLSQSPERDNRKRSCVITPETGYTMPEKCTICLSRTPHNPDLGFLFFRVAVKPAMKSDFFDDTLFEDWYTHIVQGAKSYLMKIPRKSWTNPGQAQDYRREFWEGIEMAEAEWRKGYSQKKLINTWRSREVGNPFVV